MSVYQKYAANFLRETTLVSAFDIHHHQIVDVESFSNGRFEESVYGTVEVLFIDSGGYERRTDFDQSDIYRDIHTDAEWSAELYDSLIQSFGDDVDCVLTNLDPDVSRSQKVPEYEEQIATSQAWFQQHPRFASDMLLKPPGKSRYHDVNRLSAVCDRLSAFDVIGVTEKDLGNSLRDRVKTVARLRHLLDTSDITKPIHIFGALDPTVTPLYFFAGAEIFDGLSWLRYAYHDHMATYRAVPSVIGKHFDLREEQWSLQALGSNLIYLADLKSQMVTFVDDEFNFGCFGNGAFFADAVQQLKKELKGA